MHGVRGRQKKNSPYWIVNKKTGCWEWLGHKADKTHYGLKILVIKGKKCAQQAHIWVYEKLVGKVPDDRVLDHKCKFKGCVNPKHLKKVTNLQNIRSGRRCKLNVRKVKKIRKLYATGNYTLKDLGDKYGVTLQAVHYAIRKQTWRHKGKHWSKSYIKRRAAQSRRKIKNKT